MNNSEMYIGKLRTLYDKRKIGVCKCNLSFCCRHLEICERAARAEDRKLCKGAEAHVGEKYGDPIRLVFISLDTGGSETEFGEDLLERRKTIQAVTYNCANPHMKGTIETLRHLYGRDDLDSDLLKRFAMTNSAKCSGRDNDPSMVPNKLYEKCIGHGLAELNELNPQLIVTQGVKARELLNCWEIDQEEIQKNIPSLIWAGVDVRSWICTQVKEHLKYWKMENQEEPVWVLQCPHPSARYGQWRRFKQTMLPILAHFMRQQFPDLGNL